MNLSGEDKQLLDELCGQNGYRRDPFHGVGRPRRQGEKALAKGGQGGRSPAKGAGGHAGLEGEGVNRGNGEGVNRRGGESENGRAGEAGNRRPEIQHPGCL